MENILDVDLNDVVSKEITERIEGLKRDRVELKKIASDQRSIIKDLEKQVVDAGMSLDLLGRLRYEFSVIERTESTSSSWYNSKQRNQYVFIRDVLSNIFNIKEKYRGWQCSRGDGTLAAHLAVNYYTEKDIVTNLLKTLKSDCSTEVSFINSHVMPFNYSEEDVIKYVTNPHYNTNGSIFGISSYWIERGAGKSNTPHNLIMQNPYILKDDVFELLIKSLQDKVSNYYYLFALPEYNSNISETQIELMGECLLGIPERCFRYDGIKKFISDNTKFFNKKTLDCLYEYISDNQFKLLHWESFPEEYQMIYLKSKSLEDVLYLFANNSCRWTMKRKDSFLKEYINGAHKINREEQKEGE